MMRLNDVADAVITFAVIDDAVSDHVIGRKGFFVRLGRVSPVDVKSHEFALFVH